MKSNIWQLIIDYYFNLNKLKLNYKYISSIFFYKFENVRYDEFKIELIFDIWGLYSLADDS